MSSNYIYLLTVLHMGNDFSYSQCMLDFDELLKDSFEEGYCLSNKLYLFFSNESITEIEKRLDNLKESESELNYSYSLIDATDSILNDKFKLDIEKLYSNNQDIAIALKQSINEFKKHHDTEPEIKIEDLSTQDQIDFILDKISKQGKESLTPYEIEILKKA